MFRYKLYNNYCICVPLKPGRSRVTLRSIVLCFFTKNNNLECRDVLKTVTVTSDQKRFGPYTAHKWSSGFMVLDVSYSRVLGQLVLTKIAGKNGL